jgi:hypothetical protein
MSSPQPGAVVPGKRIVRRRSSADDAARYIQRLIFDAGDEYRRMMGRQADKVVAVFRAKAMLRSPS